MLILSRDRPLEPHHCIHPRSEFRFDKEFRIGTVLTPAVRDSIVNHDELAMIAEIDAALQRTKK